MSTAVALCAVRAGYARRSVLHDIDLELQTGVTALLGPNGAGKSTLMRVLVTELRPQDGHVVLDGHAVATQQDRRRAREHIGYLPQQFGYDARFTAREHVEYLAWMRGVARRNRPAAVDAAVAQVDLTAHARQRMGALSGGMRQRAGIAGAIVGGAELLVLDEPTVGLDPGQRAHFRDVVLRLPVPRVLISTHLTDDVDAVAQHVMVLAAGAVVFDGSLSEFKSLGGSVEASYLQILDSAVASSATEASA